MKIVDLVVIGGGSAGMAAAIQAHKDGVKDILILEKNDCLGGILNQCIHNGFGLKEFNEELTGPEYLTRFADEINSLNIPYKLNCQVTAISKDKTLTYVNKEEGAVTLKAKTIILASGCYERGAGAIRLPGDRCSGIITAGTAQKFLNINGYMCGKNIVILGSGDIGLIMARRLTLEGANVICVCELMPYSNGLARNIRQCLEDFNIPLYLSTSVSKVVGKARLEKVIVSRVDDKGKFIPGSEKEIVCDTLILSVGLIPYVSLFNDINIPISSTKGAIVNEHMETEFEGIFTCGNCLHVHDTVDYVSQEGRLAGHGAYLYLNNLINSENKIQVKSSNLISYVVPQYICKDNKEGVSFKFRIRKPIKGCCILIKDNLGNIIKKERKISLVPSEMGIINVGNVCFSDIDEIYLEIVEE